MLKEVKFTWFLKNNGTTEVNVKNLKRKKRNIITMFSYKETVTDYLFISDITQWLKEKPEKKTYLFQVAK